jgi:hypothetical protein
MDESIFTNFTPEMQIILAAIQPTDIYDAHIISLIKQKIDWDALERLILSHSVLPLVYRQLRHIATSEIPAPVLEWLRKWTLASVSQNLKLTSQALRLVGQLEDHEIPSIIIKGPVWEIQAYEDLAFRQYGDIDILIQPRHFRSVYDLLVTFGFQPEFLVLDREDFFLLNTRYALNFSNPDGMQIELHWGLTETGVIWPLQPSDYWYDIIPFTLQGRTIHVLNPQIDLLYLCIHGTRHQWSSLKWITDLIWFAHNNPGFDWERLFAKATKLGFRRIVCLALNLSRVIGRVDFPPGINQAITTDPWVNHATARTLSIIEGRIQKPTSSWDVPSSLYYFFARERWRDRFGYLMGRFVKPSRDDWKNLRLPKKLFFLYYLTHAVRLGIKSFRKVLNIKNPQRF